jgi:hypothetical protein
VVSFALLVILVGQWYVTPQIAQLRAQLGGTTHLAELQDRFDALHRLSVILFGVQWLLSGAALALHARHGYSRQA